MRYFEQRWDRRLACHSLGKQARRLPHHKIDFESSLIVSNERIRHPISDLDHLDFHEKGCGKEDRSEAESPFPMLNAAQVRILRARAFRTRRYT
jgi:hypothetical protein